MQDFISIIIPVYKVEKYLPTCIESVLVQTYKNLEIILVDDGSPDKCPEICDNYEKLDGRIKVIHKTNGGLSDARNCGTEIASGKYIFYLDSDDKIMYDTIETLYNMAIKYGAEIVITTKSRNDNTNDIGILSGSEALKYCFESFHWEAWGKLYLFETIKDLSFPKGKLYEDLGFVPFALTNASRVVISDSGLYYYTERDDSIMGNEKLRISADLVEMEEGIVDYFKSKDSEIYKYILAFVSRHLTWKLIDIGNRGKEAVQQNKQYIRAYRKFFIKNLSSYVTTRAIPIKTLVGCLVRGVMINFGKRM